VVDLIEGGNEPRSSGELATAFPDEEIDDGADIEPRSRPSLNGGADVGH
jgi:hypothetical protein